MGACTSANAVIVDASDVGNRRVGGTTPRDEKPAFSKNGEETPCEPLRKSLTKISSCRRRRRSTSSSSNWEGDESAWTKKEERTHRKSSLSGSMAGFVREVATFLGSTDTATIRRQLGNHFTLGSSRNRIEYAFGRRNSALPLQGITEQGFEYEEIIGTGGFGAVLRGTRKSTGRVYALKVQPMEAMVRAQRSTGRRAGNVLSLHMERTVLVACRDHPFIVTLEYAFHTDKYAVLALECVEGGTLSTLISQSPDGCLPFKLARIYTIEIALALHFMHTKGIIYRDLKPSNILITHTGHIKLSDFGLSGSMLKKKKTDVKLPNRSALVSPSPERARNDPISHSIPRMDTFGDSDSESVTPEVSEQERRVSIKSHIPKDLLWIRRRTVCGTAGYRPPEQVQERHVDYSSRHGYDERVDWFALGVTAFTMLAGKRPFPSRRDHARRPKREREESRVGDKGPPRVATYPSHDGASADIEFQCLMQEVQYPHQFHFEPHAQDFCEALMSRDPKERPRFTEIKAHLWLRNESWDAFTLLKLKAPKWVIRHVKEKELGHSFGAIESVRPGGKSKKKTIDDFVDGMCMEAATKSRSSESPDGFTQRWTHKPSEETVDLFRDWAYISDEEIHREQVAATLISSHFLPS